MKKNGSKDPFSTNSRKVSKIAMIMGIILLTVGIACAVVASFRNDDDDDDDDDDNDDVGAISFIIGGVLGISFGVLCLVGGAVVFFCQDYCCCFMKPQPMSRTTQAPITRVYVEEPLNQSNRGFYVDKDQQPILRPLYQELPHQWMVSGSNGYSNCATVTVNEPPPPYDNALPLDEDRAEPQYSPWNGEWTERQNVNDNLESSRYSYTCTSKSGRYLEVTPLPSAPTMDNPRL